MRRLASLVVAGMVSLLIAAPAARADERVVAGPPTRYVTTAVTIDQGERLTFLNQDTVQHDVTATANGSDGKALFSSPLTSTGQENTVAGAQYLTAGSYSFYCSLHPYMKGTLTVSSAGTPLPRPGGGSGGGGAGGGAADTTAPEIALSLADARRAAIRRARAVSVAVNLNEAGSVKVSGKLVAGRHRASLGAATVSFDAEGAQAAELTVGRAARRLLASRHVSVSLTARARDRAGNVATATARATLS